MKKRSVYDYIVWAVFLILIGAVLFVALGCGIWPWSRGSVVTTPPIPRAAMPDLANYGVLDWIAGLCVLAGVAGLIASAFVPLIPRRSCATAIACGVGCWVLKIMLVKFAVAVAWVVFVAAGVAGVAVAWPLVVALRNRSLAKVANKLAKEGDVRAAVALESQAKWRKFKTKEARKERLKELTT